MERRRPKIAAPSARPIASRAEVLAALVAIQCAAAADASGAPAPAPATTASAIAGPSVSASAAPSGQPLVSAGPTAEEIPIPDLGSGATLSVRNLTPNTKPILYVDGRPIPPAAWASLAIAPGVHEIAMDYSESEAPFETRRLSLAAGSTTDLQFGHDPSVVEQLGGVQPIEHFSGAGCCGSHAVPQTATREGGPATASIIAAAVLLARRRKKPPAL